ncbi:MAG: hypothetical protein OXN17_07130 [Candidatus Poribacteria bacterium]|nr:hypothetical protein [Candidatus Poribacteria bacterium]MDE0505550.1 hypothetical protein [Candidatus Poribacteria bacterium]
MKRVALAITVALVLIACFLFNQEIFSQSESNTEEYRVVGHIEIISSNDIIVPNANRHFPERLRTKINKWAKLGWVVDDFSTCVYKNAIIYNVIMSNPYD